MAVNTWGMGPAKLIPTRKNETVVFVSDLHVPFHDTAAVAAALKLVKAVQPERVILNGDIADFFQLSRFNTSQQRLDSLQDEIDEANRIRQQFREAAPNAAILELDGNHDSRIRTYVAQNARPLASLTALEPDKLFRYKELGIKWFPGSGVRLRETFLVKHGTVTRGEAGASAKAELTLNGISGISGHTHRLATYRKAGYSPKQWTEQGCLCRLDPDYIAGGVPNWSQGIVVGEFSATSWVVHEVPFTGGKLRLGLEAY